MYNRLLGHVRLHHGVLLIEKIHLFMSATLNYQKQFLPPRALTVYMHASTILGFNATLSHEYYPRVY